VSRRAAFFLAVALTCLLLLPPTPSDLRWINLSMAALASFWCLMFAGEDIARQRGAERARRGRSPVGESGSVAPSPRSPSGR